MVAVTKYFSVTVSMCCNLLQVSAHTHTHTHTVTIPECSVKETFHYLIEQLQVSRSSRLNLEHSRLPTPVAKK
jgi:hypothetical protein